MSENRSPSNGAHAENTDREALLDELAGLWAATGENDYDPGPIDACLAALDRQDPPPFAPDAEASLAAFREKHAGLFRVIAPSGTKSAVPARRVWRTARLFAAVLAVLLGCMAVAQALGFDVFGTVARWTEETFHFEAAQTDLPTPATQAGPGDMSFSTLEDSLAAYGITDPVVPTWFPDGYTRTEVRVVPMPGMIKFMAIYEDGDRFLRVSAARYESAEQMSSVTFEKDDTDMIVHEAGGLSHYIMSNLSRHTAAWTNGLLLCSISGDVSADELTRMIDSVYAD